MIQLALRHTFAIASLVTLVCASCHGSVGGSGSGPQILFESETNDTAPEANFLGHVRPGDSFVIEGDMGYDGDFQDGFAFVAEVPVEIEYVMSVLDATSTFAVCAYDPYHDEIVFCDSNGLNPEVGAFFVDAFDAEFHVFLTQISGAANYSLTIHVRPLLPHPAPTSPDPGQPAQVLAEVQPEAQGAAAQRLRPAHQIEHDQALLARASSYRTSSPIDALFEDAQRELRRIGHLIVLRDDAIQAFPVLSRR